MKDSGATGVYKDYVDRVVAAVAAETAVALNPILPNVEQGHGRVNLRHSLEQDSSAFKSVMFDAMSHEIADTGKSFSMCVSAMAGARVAPYFDSTFKFTLVWTDRPGHPSYEKQLVNDLDLWVWDSEGTVIYPANNNDERDRLNNVEKVVVDADAAGAKAFNVVVHGYRVPEGPQPFSLVVTGPATSFGWLSGRCAGTTCPPGQNGQQCSGSPCSSGSCDCPAGNFDLACNAIPSPPPSHPPSPPPIVPPPVAPPNPLPPGMNYGFNVELVANGTIAVAPTAAFDKTNLAAYLNIPIARVNIASNILVDPEGTGKLFVGAILTAAAYTQEEAEALAVALEAIATLDASRIEDLLGFTATSFQLPASIDGSMVIAAPPSPQSPIDGDDGLKGGDIAAIILGVMVFILILIILAMLVKGGGAAKQQSISASGVQITTTSNAS